MASAGGAPGREGGVASSRHPLGRCASASPVVDRPAAGPPRDALQRPRLHARPERRRPARPAALADRPPPRLALARAVALVSLRPGARARVHWLPVAIPMLIQRVIDDVILPGRLRSSPTSRCSLSSRACASPSFTRRYATARIGIGIEARLRELLYDAYLASPRAFYDRHATGQVVSRATNDLYPIRYFIGWGVVQVCQSVMMIVGVGDRAASASNPRLALYAGLAMPLIVLLTWRFARLVTPISRVVQQRKGDVTEAADEVVVGHRDGAGVRARGRGQRALRERAEGVRDGVAARGGRRGALPAGPARSCRRWRSRACCCFGGRDVIDGRAHDRRVRALQHACCCSSCGRSRRSAGSSTSRSARSPRPAARSRGSRASQPLPEPEQPAQLPGGRSACASRTSASPTPAARRCSAASTSSIEPGEIVAVCGETGSGKSTMLNLLPALLRPDSGSVRVGGVDAARRCARPTCAPAVAARHPAAGAVLAAAARQPLRGAAGRDRGGDARGLRGGRRRRVHRRPARRLRHADRRARRQPLGRPAPARRARPRADLGRARARARRPALGRRHRDRASARRALRPALAGRTVLLASQRLSTVSLADRAVVLEDGVIVEDGAPRRAARGAAARSARSSGTRSRVGGARSACTRLRVYVARSSAAASRCSRWPRVHLRGAGRRLAARRRCRSTTASARATPGASTSTSRLRRRQRGGWVSARS